MTIIRVVVDLINTTTHALCIGHPQNWKVFSSVPHIQIELKFNHKESISSVSDSAKLYPLKL